MADAVPKDIMQYTDQHEGELHQNTSAELTKGVGHTITPAEVNPNHNPLVEKIGNTLEVIGSVADEAKVQVMGQGKLCRDCFW